MNCSAHPKILASFMCQRCGNPLCQDCYDNFYIRDKDEHLCSNCFKNLIKSLLTDLQKTKFTIWKEFLIIILGFIVGLVLGLDIYFGFGLLCPVATEIIFAPIILPFAFASLLTIIKHIKKVYQKERTSSSKDMIAGTIFLEIIINIVISPITTLIRIYKRIQDLKTISSLIKKGNEKLLALDNYITNSSNFIEYDFTPIKEAINTIKKR